MCSMSVLNRNLLWAQLVCSMGKYFECYWGYYCVLNGTLLCAQLEIIGVLNGKLNGKLCAQLDIIGVLNGNLGAQWEVMCSTGHYWGAHWEVRCSTGSYVLNGKL